MYMYMYTRSHVMLEDVYVYIVSITPAEMSGKTCLLDIQSRQYTYM